MRRQLRDQARGQPPEALGVVDLDPELLGQLAVDRLDDLAGGIERPRLPPAAPAPAGCAGAGCAGGSRSRPPAAPARGALMNALSPSTTRSVCSSSSSTPACEFRDVGRGQHEVEDHAVAGDQEVELVPEDRHLLRGHLAEAGRVGLPVRPVAVGHQVETDDRHRQAVEHALAVVGEVAARPGPGGAPRLIAPCNCRRRRLKRVRVGWRGRGRGAAPTR